MAVALDAKTLYGASQNAVTSFNDTSFTVGSGLNRALVVALACEFIAGNAPTPAVTWDGVAMTLIDSVLESRPTKPAQIFLFGLVNPNSGNKTLAVSGLNANVDSIVSFIAFTGVSQAGGSGTFANVTKAALAAATSGTATVNTVTGTDAVICAFGSNDGSPTTNQTSWATGKTTSLGTDWHSSNYALSPGASAAMTLTQSSSALIAYIGCAIVAAPFTKVISVTATTATSVVKQATKSISATATSTLALTKKATKLVQASLSSAISFTRGTAKKIAAGCTSAVSQGPSQITKTVKAGCTSATSSMNQIGKTVAASVASSVAMSRLHAFLVSITAGCAASVGLIKAVTTSIAASVSSSALITSARSYLVSIVAGCSATVDMVKSVGKRLRARGHTLASVLAELLELMPAQINPRFVLSNLAVRVRKLANAVTRIRRL
jgi:hypothetical protein